MKNKNKNNYLCMLRNKFGPFKLQYLERKEDGSVNRTKRYKLIWFFKSNIDDQEAGRRNWMFNKMNQRTLLKNELVLDIDDKNKKQARLRLLHLLNHKKIINVFENRDYKGSKLIIKYFQVFESNSGYHIHILYHRPINDIYRRHIINNIKRITSNKMIDYQIKSNHMIALEYTNHWKNKNLIKIPVKNIDTRIKKRWLNYEK